MEVRRSLPGSRLLRSLLCRDGIDQMANDARIALEGLSNGSQLRATAVLLLGISQRLAGDAEAADASMEDAAELGDRYGAAPTVSVALAERSVFAMERGDWADARTYAQAARKVVEDGGLQDYMTSILAYAAAARVALHEGDVTRRSVTSPVPVGSGPSPREPFRTWRSRLGWSLPERTSRLRTLRPPDCS